MVGAPSQAIEAQPPEEIARALEDFLTEHPGAAVFEDGRELFDMRTARYSVAVDHGRCTLHLWDDERNIVRRIAGTRARKDSLRLASLRFGQREPQVLEVLAQPERRTPTQRDTTRRRYAAHLERVLTRHFPEWTCSAFRSAMDLEKSFGPAYARGMQQRGQDAWAVVGVNADETQATIDGVLTVGLLWLQQCRDHAAGRRLVAGLRIVVPKGCAVTTISRMAWLRTDAAQWECYELAEESESLVQRDLADTGNLATHLVHAVDTQRALERFGPAVEQALDLVPEPQRGRVEIRPRSASEMRLLLHGLEFARIRQAAAANSFERITEISFGAGAQETPLDERTERTLRNFVERLFERRTSRGSQKDPLFRMAPEAWLEASLRVNIASLTDGQSTLAQFDPQHVYAQVPAFHGGDRGMLDLLTVTRDGRLAVLELKANEDLHFALQGLDYWLRVRWHHTQTADASSGLSALQQHGYFPGHRLRSLPPRLFLVAPSLRIHPVTETVLRYLKPEVEWCVLGINETWRAGVEVITRLRSTSWGQT